MGVNPCIWKQGIWEIKCQIELTPYDKIVWQWPAHYLVRLRKVFWLDFCNYGLRFCHQSIEKQTKGCPQHIFFNDSLNQIILKLFPCLLNKNKTLNKYQIYVYKRIYVLITGICQRDAQSNKLKLTSCLFFGNINVMITY